ncbi:MAG TPA: HD domain-containing phosphohydrolase [Nitrospira sp.]|nr:HD domain-containing phosphohydrolase [Nitrospira sp.]
MEARRSADLYHRAEQQLSAVASAVQCDEALDLARLSDLAISIAEAVSDDEQLVIHALGGPVGPPLVTNLINVSILSAKVGAGLGYYGKELQQLVLAALVHDIGLFAVPQSVVAKSGRLTSDERTLIEQHPELGYQLIRKVGPEWEWLALVVRQAHERWNGKGYPNKLKGRNISELAQIIGVLDVFDALVTPRPYRRRFFPHEAVRELIVAERTAFPREVVKALVEQLSAYPLGTLVRLTTGEIGTVVQINAHFPLRPVVEIGRGVAQNGGLDRRLLDLSRLPLVSVIETVEPPDVARIQFPPGRTEERRSQSVPSVSAQFSSLLESLDAIANAIQGVVATRAVPGQAGTIERPTQVSPDVVPSMDVSLDNEVIGLFALEAHEWLAQIHTAFRQLGDGPNQEIKSKLYGIILQALTNLAKSAATVHQRSIERMATNLLPILHEAGRREPRSMRAALVSLQKGIDRIADAVRQVAETGPSGVLEATASQDETAGTSFLEEISVHEEVEPQEKEARAIGQMSEAVVSGDTLLAALRDLQRVRSRSIQPTRDVLEAIIHDAEGKTGELTVKIVREILAEQDRADETFLEEVRRSVPVISRTLTDLQQAGKEEFVTASQLDPVIEQIEALHAIADRVQAGMMTMILQGLRSFLLVVAYRKTESIPKRLAALDGRIRALVPMAEQWVTIGRVGRAAIADILPG